MFELQSIKARVLLANLAQDVGQFYRKCDSCQKFINVSRQPREEITSIVSPWPLAQWRVNIIEPLPLAHVKVK